MNSSSMKLSYPAGVAHAENEARLIGALLSKQQFSDVPALFSGYLPGLQR